MEHFEKTRFCSIPFDDLVFGVSLACDGIPNGIFSSDVLEFHLGGEDEDFGNSV